ncbi:hypothetical protein K466DRAFT_569346 [Polyporus arcularius HHB13444]|uniref:Uncharacterized protein n=1 Tax=Polyporus arcularius HHB13444 TaxID=1314778 RepID=A0A5C3NX75_9APHY|nr:hypothetical protein K466DRAFT_569346 [Polyporus arcularius HHB13444]
MAVRQAFIARDAVHNFRSRGGHWLNWRRLSYGPTPEDEEEEEEDDEEEEEDDEEEVVAVEDEDAGEESEDEDVFEELRRPAALVRQLEPTCSLEEQSGSKA